MKALIAVACLMLVPAIAGDQPATARVLASPDDCAIFAVLAKEKLGWTASAPPDGNYIFESAIANGPSDNKMGPTKTYIAQCPWHTLGLAEPHSDPQGGPKNYALGYPIMDGPSEAHATVNHFDFVTANGREDLHHRSQLCKFVKRDGQWQIDSCEAEQDVIRDSHPAPK